MKSYIRIWDAFKDKMIYQKHDELLAIRDNSYWVIRPGFDNVELLETSQNCGRIMYNTHIRDERRRDIFEYDIVRRDWYSFSQDYVFDVQYGLVYYRYGWRVKLENGLELNLTQKEEGKDYRVRTFIAGNVFEKYSDMSTIPATKKKWDYELPLLLAENISDSIPAGFPLA